MRDDYEDKFRFKPQTILKLPEYLRRVLCCTSTAKKRILEAIASSYMIAK